VIGAGYDASWQNRGEMDVAVCVCDVHLMHAACVSCALFIAAASAA